MSRDASPTRVYIPGDIPMHGMRDAPAEQSHHLTHVLRLTRGAPLIVFDGDGTEYAAVIERIAKSRVTLKLSEGRQVNRESTLAVDLAQGISSGERMDYTIQKAVELGVRSIQPLASERSVVRLTAERAEKRVIHWQGVAIAACEQCGRNRVPQVRPVMALTQWLADVASDALRLTLAPDAAKSLRALDSPSAPVVMLVGPEGGLSARERNAAQVAGFQSVRLGPRILRTETAAVAALAAMQALWGDF
ncbi:MAG: 16S rRNA (uracil(1498)-N(3))-methyltransferase [Pseudomonadota bacterium]